MNKLLTNKKPIDIYKNPGYNIDKKRGREENKK
jgi:hypothetical protein